MLDAIIRTLGSTAGAHDWSVQQAEKRQTQYYVIGSSIENSRRVHSERYLVTIMNDHPARDGSSQARGQAEVSILPGDLPDLQARLAQAVFMASLTDNPPYTLAGPVDYPSVPMADTEIQAAPRELAEHTVEQLLDSLKRERGVRLSSAEVFIEDSRIAFRNSAGAQGGKQETGLLLDFVLLAAGDGDEMESHVALQRRRHADLDVPAVLARHVQYARDALVARMPRTGTFPVVISDEALAELLMSEGHSPLLLRSSAQAKYQRISPWEVGQTVLPESLSGDEITIYSNSLLPFGARSGSFDNEGHPGRRTLILENGVLRAFWAPQRYAQYLNIPATGAFGNLELKPGSQPFSTLVQGEAPFYHVVSFSAMSPDPITGDFVGEIRLGYEVCDGGTHPIRGGSISGNLYAALAKARLSRETAFLGDYLGPRAMLFEAITVAGA